MEPQPRMARGETNGTAACLTKGAILMRRAILIALLTFGAIPGIAQASLTDYETPAVKMWGTRPTDSVEYTWVDADPWGRADVCALGDMPTYDYTNGSWVAGHHIWIVRACWLRLRRVERCRVILHEWAHLLVSDPNHVALNSQFVNDQMSHVCRAWQRERWQQRRAHA